MMTSANLISSLHSYGRFISPIVLFTGRTWRPKRAATARRKFSHTSKYFLQNESVLEMIVEEIRFGASG
jgi:hypothetical protein